MKTAVTVLGFMVLTYCGWAVAQDLPPDVLADMYLLEAAKAMEQGDAQAAIRAFEKIEALDTQPPLEFLYFYGKMLVENSNVLDDVLKGQSLLKQYVLNIDKSSEHYTPTLKLLSLAGEKLEAIDAKRRAEAKRQAEARRAEEAEARRRAEAERRRIEAERQRQAEFRAKLPALLADLKKQMVRVEGGRFRMGCRPRRDGDCSVDEWPPHRVRLQSFEISKYEVTQELWEAVMGDNPSRFKDCARCPVERVSWDDVQRFLKKLNAQTGATYRLPTEAEWEYAARGGRQSRRYRYAGSNNPDSVAWYGANSGRETHPVGRKQPNELGLHDMSGNVWEWTQDCWNDSYEGAPSDGRVWERGDCSRRVVRGGSWSGAPMFLRSAYRSRDTAGNRDFYSGFRVTRTLTP